MELPSEFCGDGGRLTYDENREDTSLEGKRMRETATFAIRRGGRIDAGGTTELFLADLKMRTDEPACRPRRWAGLEPDSARASSSLTGIGEGGTVALRVAGASGAGCAVADCKRVQECGRGRQVRLSLARMSEQWKEESRPASREASELCVHPFRIVLTMGY